MSLAENDETTAIELDAETLEQDTPSDKPGEVAEQTPDDAQSDEVVVTVGEESPPSDEDEFNGKPAPDWVKELRRSDREKARKIRELEAKLTESKPAEKVDQIGVKPTLESCDFDGDKFEAELLSWNERKRKADDAKKDQEKQEQAARDAWQAKLDGFEKAKKELKVSDYSEAEEVARDVLSPMQQAVIVNGSDNPALLVYAIGKHAGKAKELAAITDPVKFAFAVAKLETQMKVTPRKNAPPPERRVSGSATTQGADATLEKLRDEASRTGDMTKVISYKAKLKAQGK